MHTTGIYVFCCICVLPHRRISSGGLCWPSNQLTAKKHTAQSPIKDTMGTHNQEVGMKIRSLSKQIAGFILGFTILLCVGFGSSVTANAQDRNSDQNRRDRNWDRYGNYGDRK